MTNIFVLLNTLEHYEKYFWICVKCVNLTDKLYFICFIKNTCFLLQYNVKRRVSAQDAMRHTYFDSLGPVVRQLSDRESIFTRLGYCQTFCIAIYRDTQDPIAIRIAIYCGCFGYDIRWLNLLCYIAF